TLTFNMSSSGLISFTPNESDIGSHAVTIFVDDQSGCSNNANHADYFYDVENVNDPPYLAKRLPNVDVPANTTIAAFFLSDYFADPDQGDNLTFTSTVPADVSVTILNSSQVLLTTNVCKTTTNLITFTAKDSGNLTADSNIVTLTLRCSQQTNGGNGNTG